MSAAWQRGLYAITDPVLMPPPRLAADVQAAIAGGAVLVQYRDKHGAPAERRERAAALLAICRNAGVPLIVNDDVALAAAVGADGVHLGRDDGDIAAARACLGPQAIVGVSCYNEFPRAAAAVGAGADYVAFGRFFPSRTKPAAVAADIELLRRARALPVPVAAIGGIDADNGATLVAAGADLLAVIAGVFGQPDPRAAAAAIARLYAPTRQQTTTTQRHFSEEPS